MSKPKCLFLFAGFDSAGVIDDAAVNYVRELSRVGDVIAVYDCDVPQTQINKIAPYVIWACGARHGEYDFGSYKRAYIYAADNGLIKKYDYVYLVNDSVFLTGPITDMLQRMQANPWDAFGPVYNPSPRHPHIQSWFIGMTPKVFLAPWFDKFMRTVTRQRDKGMVTKLYEQGFTQRLIDNGVSWGYLIPVVGRSVYNNVKKLYRAGIPFIKKNSFTRKQGALGGQIIYVLSRCDEKYSKPIVESARRTWGDAHMQHLMTRNPLKIAYRNIKHAFRKIFIEGI